MIAHDILNAMFIALSLFHYIVNIYCCCISGIEVYVQVAVQVLILMLSKTETATTEGLETIFNQTFLGLDATTVLYISISWSLFSCARMHTKLIALEKGF